MFSDITQDVDELENRGVLYLINNQMLWWSKRFLELVNELVADNNLQL